MEKLKDIPLGIVFSSLTVICIFINILINNYDENHPLKSKIIINYCDDRKDTLYFKAGDTIRFYKDSCYKYVQGR